MERYISYRRAAFELGGIPESVKIERISELKSVILYGDETVNIEYDNMELCVQLDLNMLSKGENTEKFNNELLKFLENGGLFDLAHYQKEPIPMVD